MKTEETRRKMLLLVGTAALLVSTPVMIQAHQDSETVKDLKDQAAEVKARADLARARVDALGLPSFTGNTETDQGAGNLEATMLSSHAVQVAATQIAGRVRRFGLCPPPPPPAPPGPAPALRPECHVRPIIVLAGDETLDFGRVGVFRVEMRSIREQFEQVLALTPPGQPRAGQVRATGSTDRAGPDTDAARVGALGPAGIIAAVSAAAGLLRSDVKVTTLELSAITSRVLATAIGRALHEPVFVPAMIGSVDDREGLLHELQELAALRRQVQAKRDEVQPADPDKPSPAQKAWFARFDAVLGRFDIFYTRVTTPAADGSLPIVQAQRLALLEGRNPFVLRVRVERAAGSLIRTTNIATMFALDDPIRVSGGLVASYELTEPATGTVQAAGFVTCHTAVARLRTVQNGSWTMRTPRGAGADCT